MSIMIEYMRQVVAHMKAHAIQPKTVGTQDEALALTNEDPCGHVWAVGEEYYEVANGKFQGVQANG